jgi:hypothetical protein
VPRLSRCALLAAVAAVLAAPATAFADGDPASDVLLSQSYYLPYQPPVSKVMTAKLKRVLAATDRVRYPMKVAVIATPVDLGAVPDLFGRPEQYAGFLYAEIQPAFRAPFGLVVVMPAGIGLAGSVNKPSFASTLRDVPISAGEDPDGLARAAAIAVEKVAKAAGHPVPEIVPISSGGGGSSIGARTVIITLELVALLLGVLLALRARSMRAARASPAPAGPAPSAGSS